MTKPSEWEAWNDAHGYIGAEDRERERLRQLRRTSPPAYGSRICVYCKCGRARTWVASMGYAHKRCIEANARAS